MKLNALSPKIVLGIAAHPDDLDFGFAGSMAKWAAEGASVYYLILTDGSKGSEDRSLTSQQLTEMRHTEQRQAAKIVGAKDVFFLDYEDGALRCNLDVRKEIVRYIRRLKPDVVLTMDPTMVYSVDNGFVNHPDHRAAGQATLDAVFPLARDHLEFPDLLEGGLEPHKVATVLLVNFDKHNFAVDVSTTISQKMQALAAHASQMPNLAATQKMMTDMSSSLGAQYGYQNAEAFIRLDIA